MTSRGPGAIAVTSSRERSWPVSRKIAARMRAPYCQPVGDGKRSFTHRRRPSDYGQSPMPKPDPNTREAIVDATIDIIVSDGYDAVSLSEVARRARVSLATIYKLFPTQRAKQSRTRDELIVAAVERWIDLNVHSDVTPP